MVEELINALSTSKDLRVIARTRAFAFKGKNTDVREIGRRLQCGRSGGKRAESGGKVRITAQLITRRIDATCGRISTIGSR